MHRTILKTGSWLPEYPLAQERNSGTPERRNQRLNKHGIGS